MDNLLEKAVDLLKRGEFRKAEQDLLKLVAYQPRNFDVIHMLGVASSGLGRSEQAEQYFQLAHSIDRKYPPLYQNWGLALSGQKRFEEAVDKFSTAIQLAPNFAPVYSDRGNALTKLGRYREAINDHSRAIKLAPNFYAFYNNRGNTLIQAGEYSAALADYDCAILLNPISADAFNGRGNVCFNLKRFEEALAAHDKALAIKPDLAEAWLGRGNVFAYVQRYDEAFAAYDKALSVNPDLLALQGARLGAKMHLCNWNNLEAEIGDLTASVNAGKPNAPPFAFLALTDKPIDHFHCARSWIAANHPEAPELTWRGPGRAHDKIRIGYVSSDFRTHAAAFLVVGVFECHNRQKFTITGFSLGPDDESAIRQRLVASFDAFVDCKALSNAEAAQKIADAEIDILIDLNGLTRDARTSIFARRPAPIQVNYLGYPGTMAASYMDYVIGDKSVFTLADAGFYSEKLVRLPHSYQPNDSRRRISDKSFQRGKFGLPEGRFIFCCFNNNYKIVPAVFDSWMRILNRVDGSALWLLADNQTSTANLKRQAADKGIDPDRLVFADRLELPDHLARHRLADLFLDTLPYNAHTTASDALWAGLPVLTQVGKTFAGRVAASLLNAVGLPELITHSRQDYEALAIELATDRRKLQAIKEKLDRHRLTTPLFDTPLYTRNLEAAYEAMYRRYQTGSPPDHITIAP